jgi:transcriptional regulator with GAF, ATPase, and Fis domain
METGKPYELELQAIRATDLLWTYARGESIRDRPDASVSCGDSRGCRDRKQAKKLCVELWTKWPSEKQLEQENIYLREEIQTGPYFDEIVGRSDEPNMCSTRLEQVAPTDSTVLITGKPAPEKACSRAIHSASSRRNQPLVKVNCGALSRH